MTIWGFFKKEITAMLRTPALVVAVLIMPAVQILILSGAITLEANHIRLAVDMAPNDVIMERVYNHAIGSGFFIRARDTKMDAITAVQSGNADVAIIAPSGGLAKSVIRGDGEMQVLIDSMNILKAQSIEAYLQGIVAAVAVDMGMDLGSVPIQFSTRILFNPEMNTKWFMVPSLVACITFIMLMLLITTAITKEKEMGTFETLLAAPISKHTIILGKSLPYVFVAFLCMVIVLVVGMVAFNVPFVGSFWAFVGAFLAFCVAGTGMSVLLANYTSTQQQAMLGVMIVAFLCLMLSGALIPSENFPLVLRWVSFINPLTHYVYLVRNIMLKGTTVGYFAYYCGMLCAVGAVMWWVAIRKFRITLN
ncbi:MAG: ABC transporter permease [Alphaproteobacteria bacterium]|nr:ABC transporter permease [Alphaproteobacteria bacterium]